MLLITCIQSKSSSTGFGRSLDETIGGSSKLEGTHIINYRLEFLVN